MLGRFILIALAVEGLSTFPQQVFPPQEAVKLVPLKYALPVTLEDTDRAGLRIIDLLKAIHSKQYFLREIKEDMFVIRPDSEGVVRYENTFFDRNTRGSFFWNSATNLWSHENVLKFGHFLLSIGRLEDDMFVPVELALVHHRINLGMTYEDPYGFIAEPMRRLLPTDKAPHILRDYFRTLTILELEYFASGRGADCLSRWTSVKPGGLFKKFLKLRPFRRNRNSPILQWKAVSLGTRVVNVKLWTDYETVPHAIHEEKAVLKMMREVKGFPKLLQPGTSVSENCQTRMIVTRSPRFLISLDRINRVSIRVAAGLIVSGLVLLRELHTRGIVHGSLSGCKLAFNSISKNPNSLWITDLSTARPWRIQKNEWGFVDKEPLASKSIFELEGSLAAPRDDIYRFAEVILRLIGDPSFAAPIPSEIRDPLEVSNIKRQRKLTSNRPIPTCFVSFLADVLELAADTPPPYEAWIHSFTKAFP